MSFIERMREAAREFDAPPPDPWRKPLEDALKGVDAMSTVALLDLVGARHTTKNARRLAAIMRDFKFIPIQSRQCPAAIAIPLRAAGHALYGYSPISNKVKRPKDISLPESPSVSPTREAYNV
jgi:hypothetical protein